jgi:23S rRNA pseudoU1915 N3-methylase RlmH
MKKLVVILLLVVRITAIGQERGTKKPMSGKYASLSSDEKVELKVKRMTKELNLNEKQISEVKVIVINEVEKREKAKAEMEAFRSQKKEEMKQDSVVKIQEMKKILSTEQFAKWVKMREENREKMKEKAAQKRKYKE